MLHILFGVVHQLAAGVDERQPANLFEFEELLRAHLLKLLLMLLLHLLDLLLALSFEFGQGPLKVFGGFLIFGEFALSAVEIIGAPFYILLTVGDAAFSALNFSAAFTDFSLSVGAEL